MQASFKLTTVLASPVICMYVCPTSVACTRVSIMCIEIVILTVARML